MAKNKSNSTGISFMSLLLLAFIILKLCHVIDWGWFWVLSPATIPLSIAIIFILTGALQYYLNKDKGKEKRMEDNFISKKSRWQERFEEMQKQRQQQKQFQKD